MSAAANDSVDIQKLGDERDFNVLEFVKNFRLALFDVSYNLGLQSQSTSFNAFWFINFVVEFLQLIRFMFPDDKSILVFSPAATSPFRTLCSLVDASVYGRLFGDQGAFIFSALFTILATSGFLGLILKKKLVEKRYLLKATAFCLHLLSSILFIPTLNTLLKQIRVSTLQGVIGILLGLDLVVNAVVAVIALPPTSVTSKSAISRPSPQGELGYLLFKTVYVAVGSFSSSQIVTMIVALYGGGFLTYSYVLSLPDYSYRILLLRSSVFFLTTWSGLVYAVAIFIDNPTVVGPVYMLFAGMPLIVGGSWVLVLMRLESIRKMSPEKSKHPFEIDLKSRLILQQAEQEAHKARIMASLAIFDNDDANRSNIAANANQILSIRYKESLDVLETGISKFSSSAYLQIRIAILHLQFLKINFVGYDHLSKADALSTGTDVDYLIYRTQRDNERAILESEANSEVVEFNMYERFFQTAVNHEKTLTRTLAAFWGELRQPSPDGDLLLSLADNMRNDERAARSAYKEMLKIYSRSIRTLTEYSKFLTDIAHDPGQGQHLLNRVRNLEDAQTRASVADQSFRTALFSDQSAVIVVSGDHRTLGKIINVNSAAEHLFGISRASFVGKRVELIIPEPIARKHDFITRRNLTSGNTRHLENRVLLVILLRSGLILDAIFFLKVFVENMSTLSFLAVISATNLADAQLVVDSLDGLITAASATALEFFQITKEAVDAHEVKIRDLIPNYDEHVKNFRESDIFHNDDVPGIEIEITVNDITHVVNARFDILAIDVGESAEVVRIRFHNKSLKSPDAVTAKDKDGSEHGSATTGSVLSQQKTGTKSSYSHPSHSATSGRGSNQQNDELRFHNKKEVDGLAADSANQESDGTATEHDDDLEDEEEKEEEGEHAQSDQDMEYTDGTESQETTALRPVPNNTDTEQTFTVPEMDEVVGSQYSRSARSKNKSQSSRSRTGETQQSTVQKAIIGRTKVRADQSEFGSNTSSNVNLLLSEVSRKGRTMDRTLLNFQRIYQMAQLIIVGLIVSVAIYQYIQLTRFVQNLSLVKAAGLRRTVFSKLAFLTYCMVLLNHGVTLPGRLTESFLRSNLLDASNILIQTDDHVYSLVTTKVVDENLINYVDIRIRQNQQELITPMRLHDAAAYIASRGQMAAILPLNQFVENSDLVYLMMQNARQFDNSYLIALNITTNEFVEQSISALTKSFSLWTVLSIISIFIVLFLLWMLLRPLVKTLEKDQSEIMGFFLEIPIEIIQQIEKRYQDRFESFLSAQINTSVSVNDAGGILSDHKLLDHSSHAGSNSSLTNNRTKQAANNNANAPEYDLKQVSNKGHKRSLSVGNRNSWDRVLLLVRMYILVVIVTAYVILVISLIVENPANKEKIYTKCSDMDLMTMRTSQSLLALHALILYGAGVGGDPPNHFGFSYDQVMEELDRLQLHNRFATFSSTDSKFVGVLQRRYITDTEYSMAFVTGCLNWQQTTPTLSECQTFDSGVMGNGLTFAIYRFLHAGRMAAMMFHSDRNATATGPLALGPYTARSWANVNQTLSNREFTLAAVLAIDYTFPQMAASIDSDIAMSTELFESLGSQQIAMLVVVCVASTASYFLVFQPLLVSLDDGIQQTRSLLLLIPTNIVNSMNSIKNYVKRQQDRGS